MGSSEPSVPVDGDVSIRPASVFVGLLCYVAAMAGDGEGGWRLSSPSLMSHFSSPFFRHRSARVRCCVVPLLPPSLPGLTCAFIRELGGERKEKESEKLL
eukprot:Sspe_Gene.72029::Locus_42841_Transcript_1_1_Confidence_1.000_Length_931::g.72029::m.72029